MKKFAVARLGAPMLPFVLLGDFRVFLLVLGVAEPERSLVGTCARAAAWTLVVPVVAGLLYRAGSVLAGPLPEQVLLIYECAFVALALWWRARLIGPAPRSASCARRHVAIYYALWGGRRLIWRAATSAGAAHHSEPALRVLRAGRLVAVLLAAARLTRSLVQARR
jgi:hypothetical protein